MIFRLIPAAGALAMLVTLSACAPEPVGAQPPPPPAATPTATSAASEPVVAPRTAIDLSCDDAIDATTRNDLLQGAGTLVGPTFDLREMQIAERQIGGFECWWSSTRDDGGTNKVHFAVIPNAAAEFAALRDRSEYGDAWSYDEFGDSSEFMCADGYCEFRVLVGDVWISGVVARLAALDRDRVAAAVIELTAAVAAAPRSDSTWTPPVDALQGWGRDCQSDGGVEAPILPALRELYHSPEMGSMGMEGPDPASLSPRALKAVSYCNAAGADYAIMAYAAVVVGGGWATEPAAAAELLGAGLTTVEVPGASRALVRCDHGCVGFASVNGSLVVHSNPVDDRALFVSRFGQVIGAVLAS